MDQRLSPKGIPRAQLLAAAVAIPLGVLLANPAAAASTTGVYSAQPVYLLSVPIDFILFGLTLLGVAIFHHKTLEVATRGRCPPLIKMKRKAASFPNCIRRRVHALF
jgi:hypothetical protein